jgi:Protein of unknown function (DUF4242)
MTEVVLIRRFNDPISSNYLDAASLDLGWCRKLYGVTPLVSFLALDGLRCACIFRAPDAEAVRNVVRAGKRSEPEGIWACTIHPGADHDGKADSVLGKGRLVVIERRFEAPVTFDEVQATQNDNIPHFKLHGVRSIRSYLSADRRRMVCLYEAPHADAVGHANRLSGLPFDRFWPAQLVSSE